VIHKLVVAAAALLSCCVAPAYAQSSECTPVPEGTTVLLCGASAGAGTGGGGTGGTAGQPPAGGLTLTELTLNRRIVRQGQRLEAEVTFENSSQSPIVLKEIRIAGRAPGATHAGGPYDDFAPVLTTVTIPAGGEVTLTAERPFTSKDALGKWETYATYQDAEGWHDGVSEYFIVVPSGGSGGGGGEVPAQQIGAQEWFIASWAGTNIYKSGVNWSNAYERGDDIWNPQFIAELQGYALFRHMDTNAVNWSDISRWSQRKQADDPSNQEIYIDSGSPSSTTGMALEWQIDLCNRAGLDCWFTHPYLADDDYIQQQAQLIKDKLNPSAKIYIELSNEVWNCMFSQCEQAMEAGHEIGIGGYNQYYVGVNHEMYRALQMYQIYEQVFGEGAMGSRVIRVFSESGNLDLTTQALKDVYTSSEWNPQQQSIDMIAMAPYIGSGVNGATENLERWKNEVDDKVEDDIAYALSNHVQAYDIPLFGCYEGGMHHYENADEWASNPEAYDGYQYMLSEFFKAGMTGPITLYALHGKWDSGGAWGLYDHVGQSLGDAPKARAVKDFIVEGGTYSAPFPWTLVVVLILLIGFILYILYVVKSSAPKST
jgi:hypothetical protein